MLFLFVLAKNRTSGPKGHKYDNAYAGDKSPAYPETEFFRSLLAPALFLYQVNVAEAIQFGRFDSFALTGF
jgi:hypothetical protein